MANLPIKLAMLIPSSLHIAAEVALQEYVQERIAETKETIIRSAIAHLAAYELEAAAEVTDKEPHTIANGDVGANHRQYVATFRKRVPHGEEYLVAEVAKLKPGQNVPHSLYLVWKRHLELGRRSLLLAPMLRELGLVEKKPGHWSTPVLRIVGGR